ncbi:TetR/AcrR family transcriptional regulator (plasmid) [Deinococcus taeanensis]|uniref:TetR/AcrR family transcriptional regulator n=1 Tax=Deinococcus taeanensis TaxID=2737050 RepID=UPI001CDD357F|nr:TetR/AcrR family transcriptional regulator [Deinococcus taeanensis]UBV44888.1 TetR/AcrR family transcriptional regulator [Deinococcus taeanensis]
MARPRQITDAQIVEAAHEVFLEQGFGATTAAIARRAGVSEGTLFNRFASKEDLFVAAIGLNDYGQWRAALLAQVGTGDVRRNLERALLTMLREAAGLVPKLMVMFSRGHDPSHNLILQRLDDPMRADANALAAYLQGEVQLGRVRPLDADVTALSVVGALTHFVHREQMLPSTQGALDAGRFVRGLMDVLWPGLAP